MKNACFNLFLFISVFVSYLLVVVSSSNGDAAILVRVKNTQLIDPDGTLRDWLMVGDHLNPCQWTGITCDPRSGSVVAINVTGLGLFGGFPFGFCHIRTLRNLTLVDNNLNGTLTFSSLSLCSRLQVLILTRNYFSGSLPEFGPEFRQLRVLVLESNQFSGKIPATYGAFRALKELNLNGNQLSGIVPTFLGNLSQLTRLELSFISFKPGPIPPSIGNLTKLNFLRLTDAKLIGEIPEVIGNLVFLENLDLATNALSGKIPDSIGLLKSVYQIVLYDNRLSGELPESIGNLSSLRNFDVSQNNLTGKLPEKIAALHLQSFNLNDNFFTGEIPEILALNPYLVQLKLFNNSFTGKLPEHLGRFSDLDEFDVSTNKFSGKLPPYLCYRKKLQQIITFNNNFTGDIPESYGDCDLLYYVRMANNDLSGEVPVKFWGLPLVRLELSNNRFEGSVSPSISNARNLSQLEISGNKFSGDIPAKICDLRDLTLIDLSHNRFSGAVPSCITELKKLERLRMQENTISGEIPRSVNSWPELTELNLSNNVFSGIIPPELGNLAVLNYLDLSNNKLSGEIPMELTKLKFNQFNVSNNKLCGTVPSGFQHSFFISSLLGNPGLCGPNLDPIPHCGSRPARAYILAIVTFCIVVLVSSLVWLIIKTKPLFWRKPNSRYNVTTFQRVGFTEEDIFPHLTEENVIGSGGSGRVYRVNLKSGQTLAVKKLRVGPGQGSESELGFRSEVETLGQVRHSNIVKLLMCCSGEDFRILVYEFMENASLGDVLHGEKGCSVASALDWTTRFSIAVGAAQGLAYLHHDCVPPIIHRDVKSNNILLDNEMKPHVADFGLAKTLERADRDGGAMSRVTGSYGYIAPEYAYTLKVNEKSDVYSYGIVLLELITGKRPNDPAFGENKDIVKFVMQAVLSSPSSLSIEEVNDGPSDHSRDLDKLIDPRMKHSAEDYEEIEKVVDIALLCTSSFPINRPSMRRVVELLKEKKTASMK